MTAQLAKAPFRDPAWLFEPKLDGYRMLAFLYDGALRLVSRRGLAYTRLFPAIVATLRSVTPGDCILDGEIIALGSDGRPSFNALQNRIGAATDAEIAGAERRAPAVFFCFDLLHLHGRNLRGLPYDERRALLHALVRPSAHLQLLHADEDGVALYAAALETGFEGVVAKRRASIYRPGQRSADWLKVKATSSAEFVIGGFSKGKGERERFGSLVVGTWDDEGTLRYAANVGIGFDDEKIDRLLARFAPLVIERSPFAEKVPPRAGTTWLRPELVAEVTFANWTEGGHLRAPVFLRLRDDVDPRSVRRVAENAAARTQAPPAEAARIAKDGARRAPAQPSGAAPRSSAASSDVRRVLASLASARSTIEIEGHAVKLTHPERVYWPAVPALAQAAITKLDLIRYFVRMSPRMLPHLRDRPLTIFRWPGGIEGRRVLQKHPASALPAFVETATIFSESKSADDVYLLCNNLATLVWLAEMGCLELHVWHSRVRADEGAGARTPSSLSAKNLADSAVNFPDYMLFDLDPYIYSGSERKGGEPEPNAAGFARGREVAFRLKEVLDGMSLASYVKTSGKTGLHVVVPIAPTERFDVVRRMARAICEHLLALHPKDVTTEWSTGKRTGKVFLDFNMNVRGKSIIAPYGPRGLPGAPVSMPLAWKELASAEPMQFRIPTVAARASRKDAWAGVLDAKQSLAAKLSNAVGEGGG
jgi:bifunctional non-homologous end joining protein LigD